MRKTKVVCTIGPASESPEMISSMLDLGMNVARLNMSHGDHDEQGMRIDRLKKLRAEKNIPLAIMLDTKGPEIRIRKFAGKHVELKQGNGFTLTTRDVIGDESIVSISYPELVKDIKIGRKVLIDDGLVELVVKDVTSTDIICTVINGGEISDRKGVNVPGTPISMPSITAQDIDDICFGIKKGIDLIACSFVRYASDIMEIRKLLEDNGGRGIQIIAKIENDLGLKNIDDILKVADGVMVARGDLGVEIAIEEVPMVQKEIIHKCNIAGKPVITATQMLDSMIRNPRPTRAESNDVANAILDGTDAVMLSGETAAGKYPLDALRTMCRIAEYVETKAIAKESNLRDSFDGMFSITNAVSYACYTIAKDLNAKAIITPTHSGSTSLRVSKYRPDCLLLATTTRERVYHQLSLVWGVTPMMVNKTNDTESMYKDAVDAGLHANLITTGDIVIITAGVPVGISGTTNLIKVHVVGDVLLRAKGVGDKTTTGRISVIGSPNEAKTKFQDGDILVTKMTDNDFLPYMKRASGIIVEIDDFMSHAAIVGLTLEIPVIIGAVNAMSLLKDGTAITMDAKSGFVYNGVTKAL